MAENEKCQTSISFSLKAVILLFSLLHIFTISFCGYLLYDGMQMKKELDACKSTIKLSGLSKGQAAQLEQIVTFSNGNSSAKSSANGETKQQVGGSTTRQKRQVGSSQPARGQVPCSSGRGGSRSDGNVRGPGRNIVGGSSRRASCIAWPIDTGSPGIVVTYIHWGKVSCTVGDTVYSGYAVESNSSSPICIPQSNEIQSSSQTLSTGPRLTALKYNLQETPNPLSLATLNNEIVLCALCRAQRDETFTVVGQTNCFSSRKWSTIYSGYLMAAESADGSTYSEPICVDGVPNIPDPLKRYTQTQRLRLVISGKGPWVENKLVTCAVCIRSSVVS